MKMNLKTNISLLLIILATVAFVHAAEQELLENDVSAVQIHPTGASVIRNLTVNTDTEAKTISVRVPQLPTQIDPRSIRLWSNQENASEMRLSGFEFDPLAGKVIPNDPRTAAKQATVEDLTDKVQSLINQLALLDARKQQYLDLAQSVRQALGQNADADVLALGIQIWERYETIYSETEADETSLQKQLTSLQNDLKEAQDDFDEEVSALNALGGEARFTIENPPAATFELKFQYQHNAAGWEPIFEIRATPAENRIEWVYKARLWQETGEDWNGVSVSLSSASAFDPAGLPDLLPLFLNREAESYKLESRAKLSAPLPPPQEVTLKTTTTGFYATLPGSIDISSRAPAITRSALTKTLTATFWTEATPELSAEAWLMAELTNELGWPIMPGSGFFFIDEEMVSQRTLEEVAAGETFKIALGRNHKIGLERKERLREESTSGLIDKTRRLEIKYATTVTNRMEVEHRIVLRDRFPISRNNKIVVDRKQPRNVEVEDGTGLFKWETTVLPGNTAVLETEYSISSPIEWTVVPGF